MDLMPFARNARGVQGLRASRRARFDCPARDNCMPMQVPAGAEGASAAEGRAASGRCGRRPQHRCERADARDMERAAREHRMRSRCAAGAEGARAAEGRVAPPPPASTSPKKLLGTPQWGFQPAVAPPCVRSVDGRFGLLGICSRNPCILLWGIPAILIGILRSAQNEASPWTT